MQNIDKYSRKLNAKLTLIGAIILAVVSFCLFYLVL